MIPTYDESRMAAVLACCGACGRSFYMAPVRSLCIRCRTASQGVSLADAVARPDGVATGSPVRDKSSSYVNEVDQ